MAFLLPFIFILLFLFLANMIGYTIGGVSGLVITIIFTIILTSPIILEYINYKSSKYINFNNRLILNKKDVNDFIAWTSNSMFIFDDKQNNLLCSIGGDNIFGQYNDNIEKYAFQKAFAYTKKENSRPFRYDDENNPDYGLTLEAYIWKHRDDINDKLKEIEAYKKEYREKMELNQEFN